MLFRSDLGKRVRFLEGSLFLLASVKRMEVSNIEIWTECFGKAKEDMRKSDSYSIAMIMSRIDDWEKTERTKRIPIYGKQRIYVRKQ